jgi:glucokinase
MKSVGVDIGGTKTAIGIVDTNKGSIDSKIVIPSKKYRNDKKNLNLIINKSIELAKAHKIKHIGIGVPELINNNGIIKGDYNFKWNNYNLTKFFPSNYFIKVESDVRCHLLAEKRFGKGKNINNFIYINIGSGLSYAQFKEKKIYSGSRGYAIHFASSLISLYDWKKNKKISLVPEDYYSGKDILKIEKIFKDTNKRKKILIHVSESIGSLIASLINTVDPQQIILGGGVIVNNIFLKNNIIKFTKKYILAKDAKKIKISVSKFRDNTGILGAGLLFK